MKKVITVAILFFSYSCFSQTKSEDKKSVEKTDISVRVLTLSTDVSNENGSLDSSILKVVNDNYSNFYRRKSTEITENPLNVKLALPHNFNWLHYSVV